MPNDHLVFAAKGPNLGLCSSPSFHSSRPSNPRIHRGRLTWVEATGRPGTLDCDVCRCSSRASAGHQPRIFIQSTTTQILNVHKTLKKKTLHLDVCEYLLMCFFRSSFYVLFPSLLRMAWLRPPPESTQRFVQGVQPSVTHGFPWWWCATF